MSWWIHACPFRTIHGIVSFISQFFSKSFVPPLREITIHDETCIQLVESKTVGLGQLFRHLDILPSFTLLDAGYHAHKDEGMWRRYELSCNQLSCRIEERFAPNIWNIQTPL